MTFPVKIRMKIYNAESGLYKCDFGKLKMHTLSFKRFCFKSRNDVYKGLKNTEKDQYQKLKVYQNLFFLTCMYIVCNSTNYMPDKKNCIITYENVLITKFMTFVFLIFEEKVRRK